MRTVCRVGIVGVLVGMLWVAEGNAGKGISNSKLEKLLESHKEDIQILSRRKAQLADCYFMNEALLEALDDIPTEWRWGSFMTGKGKVLEEEISRVEKILKLRYDAHVRRDYFLKATEDTIKRIESVKKLAQQVEKQIYGE